MTEEMFQEYVEQSDKIGKRKNEHDLQRHLKAFLKGELKSIVANFVRLNQVKDPQLAEKAKSFSEIFNTKFSKIFSVLFKLDRRKFLMLVRASDKNTEPANRLWNDFATKYDYFKAHGVLNSDLLKGFVRQFLTHALIQKEIQFFMMYHFDLIHDFDTSKLITATEKLDEKLFEGDDTATNTDFGPSHTGLGPDPDAPADDSNNVFNISQQPLLSVTTTDNKHSLNNLLQNDVNSKLNDGFVVSTVSNITRSQQPSINMQSKIVPVFN